MNKKANKPFLPRRESMALRASASIGAKPTELSSETQQIVVSFLADPRTHGGIPVKRIDTHCASIFLAGETAFKLKREVQYPYLDYSTIERRKKALEEELTINRTFTPGIYERVAPITRSASGLIELDGQGEALDTS